MFSDKLNYLLTKLNCTNAEFSRTTGYSSSSLGRYKSGSRTPSPNSRALSSFMDSLLLYINASNIHTLVCDICDIPFKDNNEYLKKMLTLWLFDNSDIYQIINSNKQVSKSVSYFGEKLKLIMDILGVSNVKLAKMVIIDPSYISRYRCGVRIPKAGNKIISRICDALYSIADKQCCLPELASIINAPIERFCSDKRYAHTVFIDWLYSSTHNSSDDAIDTLLERIDTMPANVPDNLPSFEALISSDILTEQTTTYYGLEGMRNAVKRFLGNVATKGKCSLYLYSDESMKWMIEDKDFFKIWSALMIYTLSSDSTIHIIHNVNRNVVEMLAAIESWLPLYTTGLIKPYYYNCTSDSRFSQTLFLSLDHACIRSHYVRGLEEEASYNYITSSKQLYYHKKEFNYLLSTSKPLVNIYKKNDYELFIQALKISSAKSNSMYMLSKNLSIATMPYELIHDILKTNNIQGPQLEEILRFYNIVNKSFYDSLNNGKDVYEFISINSSIESRLKCVPNIDFCGNFTNNYIVYTHNEYAKHIQNILNIAKKYPNYHICLMSENPFSNINILIKDKKTYIFKTTSPSFVMIFEHHLMISSFITYLDALRIQMPIDKNQLNKQLTNLLDK